MVTDPPSFRFSGIGLDSAGFGVSATVVAAATVAIASATGFVVARTGGIDETGARGTTGKLGTVGIAEVVGALDVVVVVVDGASAVAIAAGALAGALISAVAETELSKLACIGIVGGVVLAAGVG